METIVSTRVICTSFIFFKQKTAYEMRISDWSSDVCSSDLRETPASGTPQTGTPESQGFGRIQQGFLETSNVNVVEEITNLITAQRAYEMNSKVIETSDQMMATLTNLR